MKKLFTTIVVFHITFLLYAQNQDIKAMVDSLQYLKADTLDCSADLYWRIIAKGDKAIPFLIDKLTDTTQTSIRYHCKATPLNVAEVAQFALTEIAFFPAFSITHIQFDVIVNGCWNFYDFFFRNTNKPFYQDSVKRWYAREASKYKHEKILKEKQSPCQKIFGITTYYKWDG